MEVDTQTLIFFAIFLATIFTNAGRFYMQMRKECTGAFKWHENWEFFLLGQVELIRVESTEEPHKHCHMLAIKSFILILTINLIWLWHVD